MGCVSSNCPIAAGTNITICSAISDSSLQTSLGRVPPRSATSITAACWHRGLLDDTRVIWGSEFGRTAFASDYRRKTVGWRPAAVPEMTL